MKDYLLHNDSVQHEHRLFLEKAYAELRGKTRVYFSDILHELMAKEVRRLKASGARHA